jgi:hypothetical protein
MTTNVVSWIDYNCRQKVPVENGKKVAKKSIRIEMALARTALKQIDVAGRMLRVGPFLPPVP